MQKFYIAAGAIFLLVFTANAQNINPTNTDIGFFEAQSGAVIVKGFATIGSMSVGDGILSVRCKESSNVSTGRKLYGVAIEMATNAKREILLVDDDEIDPLVNGIDYLSKISYNVTTLPAFDASFVTKSGLRFVAYTAQRQGGIQNFVQFTDEPRILLTATQFAQFENLVSQAKNSIDALKNSR